MNANPTPTLDATRVTGARRWLVAYPRAIPLAIFLAISAITALSVYAIESNERAREKAQLNEYARSVANALERRGNSFASYLRAGAALFSSYDEVSPQLFRQFVAELRLDVEYRGAEGIGWIDMVQPQAIPAYVARNRAAGTGFAAIRPAPGAQGQAIAPVTYFAPESARSRRALGFDMHSDPVRAAALDEARRTVRPTASGRVEIAQEGEGGGGGGSPGFVIFMPAYKAVGARRQLAGFVYSPFIAEGFLDDAIDSAQVAQTGVALYDGDSTAAHLLAARTIESSHADRVEQSVTIANRELRLVVERPDQLALAPLSMVTLLFGTAVAILLMLLARLLTRQAYEDQARLAFYEQQNSIRNLLTRELNHRVKNTLANVLSILSLTRRRTNNLDDFADSLEGRIRALSATHDLLTHSDWGTIPIRAVIEAELQHFRAGSDEPIALDGPEAELAPNDALSFGLALHELATNAAKYGSLGVAEGTVSVTWRLLENNLAEVEWRERGGPPVAELRSRGFGTELIEKIVAHELRNPVQLEFHREGVRCVMRVPIRRASEFRIRQS